MSVTANPITEGVLLSNAPNVFTAVQTSNAIEDNYRLTCKVELDGKTLIEMSRIPNFEGAAHFELREVLRQTKPQNIANRPGETNDTTSLHYLPASVSSPRLVSYSRANITSVVTITIGESYLDAGAIETNTFDTFTCNVIHGALQHPRLTWDADAYKVQDSSDAKPLSARDANYPAKPSDNGVVSFFVGNNPTMGAYEIQVIYFDINGALISTDTNSRLSDYAVSVDFQTHLHHFAFYPDGLERSFDILSPPANWHTYTVQLRSSSGTPTGVSIPLTFTRECESKFENVRLGFVNELGGWDYVNFDLRSQHTERYDKSERTALPGSWSNENFIYQTADRGLTTDQSTYRLQVRCTRDASIDEVDVITQLVASREVVWLREFNAPVAVRITDNNLRRKKKGDRDYQTVSVSFEVAINNQTV